ncbi:MAG: hypothetical protein M1840_000189 [Geoglossum simile]|nr:MAG: hypothetical protein M1840_000189 [Geoglossum simile]
MVAIGRGGMPEPPPETVRERELYRYYRPPYPPQDSLADDLKSVLPLAPCFQPGHVPQSSSDTGLSALAQLVALRLNACRALISVIDRTHQYILAEATQTTPFGPSAMDNGQDKLWFGCTRLPRSQGLCEMALEIVASSEDRSSPRLPPLVVSNPSQDETLKDRPFSTCNPSFRFYAAVPISTRSGFNIGAICVMGDKPRDGLNDAETRVLGDMALTVMAHLEMVRVQEGYTRNAKMVKGLGLFMEKEWTVYEWWLRTGTNREWPRQSTKESVEGQLGGGEIGPQLDLDLLLGPKEDAPSSETTKPKATAQFEIANAQAKPSAELLPSLTMRGEGSELSAASCPRQQRSVTTVPTGGRDVLSVPRGGEGRQQAISSWNSRSSTSAADFQGIMVSNNPKEVFSRASNIIRECIEVDGVLFLDASIGILGGFTGGPYDGLGRLEVARKQSYESIAPSDRSDSWGAPRGDGEAGKVLLEAAGARDHASQQREEASAEKAKEMGKACEVLGFSIEGVSSLKGGSTSRNPSTVTEVFLQELLHSYPRGHVFSIDEGGSVLPSGDETRHSTADISKAEAKTPEKEESKTRKANQAAKQAEEAKTLLPMLPGARSVAIFPLWDSHRERWFAGGFAWTTKSTRVLTHVEDLRYLAAFGNSIMAEVARLDALVADRAKTDFISSISHELRTPLHGILASVEFIQDTALDLFQHSMIDTVERCGRTLLDTIQHVLVFAKINHLTGVKRGNGKRSGQGSRSEATSLNANIDLSAIIEDVVDAMYAGHEFQGSTSFRMSNKAGGFPSDSLWRNGGGRVNEVESEKKDRVTIILDIDWRPNWVFNTRSGELRGVLMNLFGNALKYTDAGWVKVSLRSKDIKPEKSQLRQSIITITVSDSGRGISPEFLRGRLFTPFSQENSLNAGTGLGLSIALQIVRSLGGTIDVQSEQGVGTEVKVSLVLEEVSVLSQSPGHYDYPIMSVRKKTSGRTLCLVGFNISPDTPVSPMESRNAQPEPLLSLQASIEGMATRWFGMKVATSPSQDSSPPDIYIADEKPSIFGGAPMIVLCSYSSLYASYVQGKERASERKRGGVIHFISKPCGPRKLAKALDFCLSGTPNLAADHGSPPSAFEGLTEGLTSETLFNTSLDPMSLLVEPASRSLVEVGLGVRSGPQDRPEGPLPESITPSQASERYFTLGSTGIVGERLNAPQPSSSEPVAVKQLSAGIAIPTTPVSVTSQAPGPVMDVDKRTRQRPTLLLVEDNHINLRLLVAFAQKNRFDYETAENGLMALQMVQNAAHPFDVVFMDISMPVMDGIESAREIRKFERERDQKHAIIVAITGVASASIQQEAFSSGLNIFLTKPVSFRELRTFLDDWTPGMEPRVSWRAASVGS